jgi:hypothetical protein
VELVLFAGVTLLVHFSLAAAVGSHAEVHGYNQWRWAPIVLITGVVGVLLYLRRGEPPAPDDTDPAIPDRPPPSADRSHRKRLADPNTLHLDLPDGTTLTGSERAAVAAVIEEAIARGGPTADHGAETSGDPTPDPSKIDWSEVETEATLEAVFAEHDAGYSTLEVWWTDRMRPALQALPDVPTPPDAEAFTLDLRVRERPYEDEGQRFLVDDGDRSAEFRRIEGRIELFDSDTGDQLTPAWVRLAKTEIEAIQPTPSSSGSRAVDPESERESTTADEHRR